jgi:Sigma-70, region 4
MAPVDSLPADQQAVLQLLLRQGRSYAQIAGMLKISDAAVRERAQGALTALGPPAGDLSARRRAEIGDWLLGQADDDERADTEALLDRDERARAWADAVADELAPLGGERVPAVPAPPPAEHTPTGEEPGSPADGPPAAPAPADEPPAAAPTRVRAAAQAASATPRPHSSRVGGAVLLSLLALVAVVVVVLVTRGGDDDGGGQRAASTTSTQGDAAQSRVVAQVNLRAPDGAPAAKALGIMQVLRVDGQLAINAIFEGLPRPKAKNVGYGIWLSTPGGERKWLGFVNTADEQGRLVVQGRFNENVTAYRDVLLTRETRRNPPRPGTIYLRGRVRQAPAQGSG